MAFIFARLAALARGAWRELPIETTAVAAATASLGVAILEVGGDRLGRWLARVFLAAPIVTAIAFALTLLARGSRIHRIDGRDAREVFEHEVTHNSGSLRFRRWVAGKYFGEGVIDNQAIVDIERDGQPLQVSLTRGKKRELPLFDHKTFERLDGDIWYVDLNAASPADIAEHLQELTNAPGVVFDLRVYPYRGASILEHLLPQDDHHNWMFIPRIVYPDRERLAGWSEMGWSVLAKEPRIRGELVFLTGGRAVSAAESLMGFVEAYDIGQIVGEPTAGTNGNVDLFDVPGGFQIRWTGMKVLKHDGSQQHLVGILPTIPVTPTIQGIRDGRDELLEKAVQLIMKGQ